MASSFFSVYYFKFVFANKTYWALPIVGQILKSRAGRNAIVSIAYCRIINIIARNTSEFRHINTFTSFSNFWGRSLHDNQFQGFSMQILALHLCIVGKFQQRAGIIFMDSLIAKRK